VQSIFSSGEQTKLITFTSSIPAISDVNAGFVILKINGKRVFWNLEVNNSLPFEDEEGKVA